MYILYKTIYVRAYYPANVLIGIRDFVTNKSLALPSQLNNSILRDEYNTIIMVQRNIISRETLPRRRLHNINTYSV